MAEVIEINSLEKLAPYRMVWNALLQQTPGATFFQTYDWLELYWKHFGENQRLRVLVVTSNDEPIGIVPLCERIERHRLGRVRVLTYPLDHWGTWYGPIGPNVAASLLMAMRHVRGRRAGGGVRTWDLLELRWTSAAGADRGRTQRAMHAVGLRPQKAEFQLSSAIDLNGTWDHYAASRTSKWRNNLQRDLRRVQELGEVQCIRHRPAPSCEGDGDPNWGLYDACVQIATRSWQGDRKDGTTLSNQRVEAFLRDTHAAAARLGMLDMNVLSIDGRPAAFAYNYHHDCRVQGLRSGFDPNVCTAGAGSVLLYKTIEGSFALGDKHYDLGIDYHGYKRGFRTHTETSYRFSHYHTGVRGQALRVSRWLKGRLAAASRAAEHLSPTPSAAK